MSGDGAIVKAAKAAITVVDTLMAERVLTTKL